jgi:hypothetical protein
MRREATRTAGSRMRASLTNGALSDGPVSLPALSFVRILIMVAVCTTGSLAQACAATQTASTNKP